MTLPRSTAIAVGVLACLLYGRAHLLSQGRTLITHEFEASTHGWQVSGDTGTVDPQLHASGGDPGGYLSHADEAMGETWYFSAPASVLTALAAAEHGTLSYSLKQSEPVVGIFEDDIVILGPAGRLSYRYPTSPGTRWTTFSVPLTAEVGWRWNWNRPATQQQIHSVLANPTSLEIRGEYHTGPDEGGLDTVVLETGAQSRYNIAP
jgi:hypothetical protein